MKGYCLLCNVVYVIKALTLDSHDKFYAFFFSENDGPEQSRVLEAV